MELQYLSEQWMSLSDDSWYEMLLEADPQTGSISTVERAEIIERCKSEASRIRELLSENYGAATARGYAERLGLKVCESIEPVDDSRPYFGLFLPVQRTILVQNTSVRIVKAYIHQHELQDMVAPQGLDRLVIFHELYHALEEMTPGIYTRSRMVSKRYLNGLFTRRLCPDSVSEIGAIHFSKLMTQIDFSPCVYTRLLSEAVQERSAANGNCMWEVQKTSVL